MSRQDKLESIIEQSLDRDIEAIERERINPQFWKRNEQFFSQMEIRVKEEADHGIYGQSNESV